MHRYQILVSIAEQLLRVIGGDRVLFTFPISTASAGVGSQNGSGCTPLGKHGVARLFGHNAPLGQVFSSRCPVEGKVLPPSEWCKVDSEKDYVLTRIIWLKGLEPGLNAGGNVDTQQRYIYIHGTNQEQLLGKPASHGCIRMANLDVVKLFDFVKEHSDITIEICEK